MNAIKKHINYIIFQKKILTYENITKKKANLVIRKIIFYIIYLYNYIYKIILTIIIVYSI